MILKRLSKARIWKRIFYERLSEPVHLNVLSVFTWAFGSFRWKQEFDLVLRPHSAFGLLKAADWAKELGITRIAALEFGVANGAGLENMRSVAQKVTEATGVGFDIFGFDTGVGMPPPIDYRDHPEFYNQGDFPMENRLEGVLFGDVAETVPQFLGTLQDPIGFISMDLDYYSSTMAALEIPGGEQDRYLPSVVMYFDDVTYDTHNEYCGELLAIKDFTSAHPMRPITKFNLLRQKRLLQRAPWIDQMYLCHVLDHSYRRQGKRKHVRVLDNPFFGGR